MVKLICCLLSTTAVEIYRATSLSSGHKYRYMFTIWRPGLFSLFLRERGNSCLLSPDEIKSIIRMRAFKYDSTLSINFLDNNFNGVLGIPCYTGSKSNRYLIMKNCANRSIPLFFLIYKKHVITLYAITNVRKKAYYERKAYFSEPYFDIFDFI